MATQDQLRTLSLKPSCDYLGFDETSGGGHVETHSGSIQMFRPNCGFKKVRQTSAVCAGWNIK